MTMVQERSLILNQEKSSGLARWGTRNQVLGGALPQWRSRPRWSTWRRNFSRSLLLLFRRSSSRLSSWSTASEDGLLPCLPYPSTGFPERHRTARVHGRSYHADLHRNTSACLEWSLLPERMPPSGVRAQTDVGSVCVTRSRSELGGKFWYWGAHRLRPALNIPLH